MAVVIGNVAADLTGRRIVTTNHVIAGEAFTGDGGTVAFVLSATPASGTVAVYVNGVRVTTWTLSTATVTFASALAIGDEILVDYCY